jgi:hypothetical protein
MNTKFIFPATTSEHKKYMVVDKQFLIMLKETKDTKIVHFQPEEHSAGIEYNSPETMEKMCKKIENLLRKNNCTLEFWIGNFIENDQRLHYIDQNLIKIINWPEYLMMLSYHNYTQHHKDPEYLPVDKLYTCLNRRQNYHRSLLMREIFENNIENYGYISFLRHTNNKSDSTRNTQLFSKKIVLDIGRSGGSSQTWAPPGEYYHKSLINVITETSTCIPDISEKTWFSILHKRPFMVLGYTGIHKKLREMGFILFDSIIDYSFDEIDNDDFKVNAIIDNLKRLKDCDYQKEFNKLIPILEHNRLVFLKHISNKDNFPDLSFFNGSWIQQYKRVMQECANINV